MVKSLKVNNSPSNKVHLSDLVSLHHLMACLVLFIQETFHQIISFHQNIGTSNNLKEMLQIIVIILSAPHMHPEPMPFNQKVLGMVGEMLIFGVLMRGTVILEDATMNMSKHLVRHNSVLV